jgi:DNA-directed RNA polymerase specialized sigma24 family protein
LTPVGAKSSIAREAAEAADLLREYTCVESDVDAAAALNRLFGEFVWPWCAEAARRTLRNYGVRGTDQRDEASDIAAEVTLYLTGRLQEIRSASAPDIGNLRAYAVSAVYNVCFARVRARCPRHVQLQNRVRYLLRNDREFATWVSQDGEQLAGLQAWNGRDEHVAAPVPERSGQPLKDVLKGVFDLARGPVRLGELISATADSLGIVESSVGSLNAGAQYPAEQAGADQVMLQREALLTLWHGVLQLPAAQRIALLLNLRDAGGHGVIELIPATGAASFEQLAETINLTPRELARMWPELPLEDARIAEMLGLTRQQVINLRKSARERLARRQRKADGNTRAPSASYTEQGVGARMGEKIKSVFRRRRENDDL